MTTLSHTDQSIRSTFPSDEVATEWACTASWPQDLETSIWEGMRICFKSEIEAFQLL